MLQYLYPDLSNDEKPSIDLKSDYPLSYLWHPEEAANIKTYFESNCEAIEVLIFKGNKTITIKCGLARNPSFNRLFRKIYEK